MIKFAEFYQGLAILIHFTHNAQVSSQILQQKGSKTPIFLKSSLIWTILDFYAFSRACKTRTAQAMTVKFGEVIHHN